MLVIVPMAIVRSVAGMAMLSTRSGRNLVKPVWYRNRAVLPAKPATFAVLAVELYVVYVVSLWLAV